MAACAKHYVGDGGTVKGINENDTVVTPRVLFGIHMPPYYVSIIKGVSTIMVSYSSVNGVKMHANERLVTRFLKKRLHFEVISNLLLVVFIFFIFLLGKCRGLNPQVIGHLYNWVPTRLEVAVVISTKFIHENISN